ncbi:MAG: hypothetical protein ABFC80_02205, partial [Coriobacteriales bacterium]
VRETLRRELTLRGFEVADDTVSVRGELYVKGQSGLAGALFEFSPSVSAAIDALYRGHWSEGLPPRYAVLPAETGDDPAFELLEQMHIHPLLYEIAEAQVVFHALDAALTRLP